MSEQEERAEQEVSVARDALRRIYSATDKMLKGEATPNATCADIQDLVLKGLGRHTGKLTLHEPHPNL
jgi:hypothetical protein